MLPFYLPCSVHPQGKDHLRDGALEE